MKETDKALNILVNEIFNVVNRIVSKLYYDTTFLSTVVGINEKGKYIIIKQGHEYPVTNATNFDFKVGQSVWVKIPSGIIEDMHICGIKRK